MRTPVAFAALLALGISAVAAPPPVIRKSPELTIAEPSGKTTLLSSYKGKVVVVTFIYTTCIHCQRETQMVTKLYHEMAPRGLQVLGVAFNDNAAMLVPDFVKQFAVPYPIGHATPDTVLNYLGFSVMLSTAIRGNETIAKEKRINFLKHTGELILQQVFSDDLKKEDWFAPALKLAASGKTVLVSPGPDSRVLIFPRSKRSK